MRIPWRRRWAAFVAAATLAGGIWSAGPATAEPQAPAVESARHRGYHEVTLRARDPLGNPFTDTEVQVVFSRPDGSAVTVDAFYDGEQTYRARAYCDTTGTWSWRSRANRPSLDGVEGHFTVAASSLPGKLRVHPDDRHQLAYDDGRWFLHIGDTAYRYVVDTEPDWQVYIDQAAEAGFTKVRTWFARSRHHVEALLTEDRSGMNVPYWREIERRLLYALDRYPHIIFQLVPYAEDAPEIRRYGAGDAAAIGIGRYAQARLSALPNVTWVISNDLTITVSGKPPAGEWRDVDAAAIDRAGRDFRAREPWRTLLANHQARYTGYAFVDASWSDLIILEDLDQVDGALILDYRARRAQPVILEEDRYERHRNPAHPRYFFRRLLWASILSGGHATYGGNRMYEPHDGTLLRGVHGYFDLVRAGILAQGAHDFVHIRTFFTDAALTAVGLRPDDAAAGGDPRRVKVLRNEDVLIAYLANPSGTDPRTDVAGWDPPSVTLTLPGGRHGVRWFNPRNGTWHDGEQPVEGDRVTLTAPHPENFTSADDWVLLLRRR
jgi:hypothetical protein